MNKEIYKQNITALRNKYPAWANIIKNRHKKKNIDVIVEKSVTGDTILKVKKNGKILYLNGKYAYTLQKSYRKFVEKYKIVILKYNNSNKIKKQKLNLLTIMHKRV